MDLKRLKELLDSGEITQEQFETMKKTLGIEEETQEPSEGQKPEPNHEPPQEEIEKMIQRAVDRATNKLGNENKNLREQLEKIKKEKLTEDEKKRLEAEEKERELLEREAAVKASENKLIAIKAIKKAGLDDGSETALEILEMVKGEDEESIKKNVSALKTLVDRLVKAEVEKTFKGSGRKPDPGTGASGDDNPYSAKTFNLTKQMELESSNPELAKKYRMAAGNH